MRTSNPHVDLLAKAFKENNVDSIDILYQDGTTSQTHHYRKQWNEKNLYQSFYFWRLFPETILLISIYVALQIILADRNRQIRDIIFNYK